MCASVHVMCTHKKPKKNLYTNIKQKITHKNAIPDCHIRFFFNFFFSQFIYLYISHTHIFPVCFCHNFFFRFFCVQTQSVRPVLMACTLRTPMRNQPLYPIRHLIVCVQGRPVLYSARAPSRCEYQHISN